MKCLAAGTPAADFAQTVDRTFTDFTDDERPRHLAAARHVAGAGRKAALRTRVENVRP